MLQAVEPDTNVGTTRVKICFEAPDLLPTSSLIPNNERSLWDRISGNKHRMNYDFSQATEVIKSVSGMGEDITITSDMGISVTGVAPGEPIPAGQPANCLLYVDSNGLPKLEVIAILHERLQASCPKHDVSVEMTDPLRDYPEVEFRITG